MKYSKNNINMKLNFQSILKRNSSRKDVQCYLLKVSKKKLCNSFINDTNQNCWQSPLCQLTFSILWLFRWSHKTHEWFVKYVWYICKVWCAFTIHNDEQWFASKCGQVFRIKAKNSTWKKYNWQTISIYSIGHIQMPP